MNSMDRQRGHSRVATWKSCSATSAKAKLESGTITKIRVADRLEALELLGRHLKLFTDKLEVTDSGGILARLKKGRERVAKAQ